MLVSYIANHFFTLIIISIIHYDRIFLCGFALGLIKIRDSLLIDISLLEVNISLISLLFIACYCLLFGLFMVISLLMCFT